MMRRSREGKPPRRSQKREARFAVLDRIKSRLPEVPSGEVKRDVKTAIRAVRDYRALSPRLEKYTDKRIHEFLREDQLNPAVRRRVKRRLSTRVQLLFISIASVGLASGCACFRTSTFSYPPKTSQLLKLSELPKHSIGVAVLPFQDARGSRNAFHGFFLYMVPGVWNGVISYERPDTAKVFNSMFRFKFHPSEDLARAALVSLKTSNLFREVYFAPSSSDLQRANLIFSGTIHSTRYYGKVYSYGLSVLGPALCSLGLPTGSSTNELGLELTVGRTLAQEPIWRYTFRKEKTIVRGLYYNWENWGRDVELYSELMEEGMNEAVKDLDQKLPSLIQ